MVHHVLIYLVPGVSTFKDKMGFLKLLPAERNIFSNLGISDSSLLPLQVTLSPLLSEHFEVVRTLDGMHHIFHNHMGLGLTDAQFHLLAPVLCGNGGSERGINSRLAFLVAPRGN